ncbi:MAG TPA: DUF4340 domain-containing protein [Candidatus Sulfotelmatobacter sp.]|nr:DUF4340 domain-containing protein [Candidatus Sulfotelmatobacter sp.]
MIKKPTLFILLGAILLGAAVYFFDWKRSLKKEALELSAESGTPAFAMGSAADIKWIKLARPAELNQTPIQIEKRGDTWEITQPLPTEADQPSLEQMVSSIAGARVETKLPGTPDRLKAYGLDPPAVTVEFRLANGSSHTLKLGGKDFTGMSVYAVADGSADVTLLPMTLLSITAKSFDQLRDHNVLHFATADIASFDLKNSSGEIAAAKQNDNWNFIKPASGPADSNAVQALLGSVTGAKMASIASETPDNPAKYGLTSPGITFTAADAKGRSLTLIVGKKDGGEYFARDNSRPMIFRMAENVHKSLASTYSDLRDKRVVRFDAADVNHIELRNSNGTMSATRKAEENWTIDSPGDQKGKPAGAWKILTPFTAARAEEVIDHPSAAILALLAKAPVEATFTDKNGKKITVRVSAVSDDFVYAQTSDGSAVYKLRKQLSNDLNFKASDLAM